MKRLDPSGGSRGMKKVPGGPDPSSIGSLSDMAKEMSYGTNSYVVSDAWNQRSNDFPYVPFARDDYDDVANVKAQFAQGGARQVVTLDKSDAEHVLRQRAQVESADFDRWVMQKYDLTDPAQNFLMQQLAPEQFKRRSDLIEAQQNLATKYALLRLLGPKSLEDLKFQWMIETGRVELPKGPVWDPLAWMDAQLGLLHNGTADTRYAREAVNINRYKKGLFNPLRYLDENQVGFQAGANRADIGSRGDKMEFQLYAGSKAQDPYSRPGFNPMWTFIPQFYGEQFPGVVAGDNAIGRSATDRFRRNNYNTARGEFTSYGGRELAPLNPTEEQARLMAEEDRIAAARAAEEAAAAARARAPPAAR